VFLEEYSPGSLRNGPIINVNGDVIGSHQGLANYTIGQRKKLEVSSPEALYVLRKDVQNNSIIVGSISERGTNKFIMREINWVSGESINSPFEGNVKIRYRSKEVLSKIIPLDTQSARVEVYSNIRDITPGQIAVVYINDEVICSGTISFNDI
jgi:tRNA-specific 2-thiouridylase